MSVRSAAERLLRWSGLLCTAGWTLLFLWLATGSVQPLIHGVERAAVAVKAAFAGEPCAFLFRSAGESFLRFAVEFAVYFGLAWWGMVRLRKSVAPRGKRKDERQ